MCAQGGGTAAGVLTAAGFKVRVLVMLDTRHGEGRTRRGSADWQAAVWVVGQVVVLERGKYCSEEDFAKMGEVEACQSLYDNGGWCASVSIGCDERGGRRWLDLWLCSVLWGVVVKDRHGGDERDHAGRLVRGGRHDCQLGRVVPHATTRAARVEPPLRPQVLRE